MESVDAERAGKARCFSQKGEKIGTHKVFIQGAPEDRRPLSGDYSEIDCEDKLKRVLSMHGEQA
jgi:hypothetical protein